MHRFEGKITVYYALNNFAKDFNKFPNCKFLEMNDRICLTSERIPVMNEKRILLLLDVSCLKNFLKFAANQEEKSFENTIRNIERGAIFVYHRSHRLLCCLPFVFFQKRQGRIHNNPTHHTWRSSYTIFHYYLLHSSFSND